MMDNTGPGQTVRARRISEVERFAKQAEATVRSQRFQPTAVASGRLWEQLRQDE